MISKINKYEWNAGENEQNLQKICRKIYKNLNMTKIYKILKKIKRKENEQKWSKW